MKYRKLKSKEIGALERQGCSARDWSLIAVAEEFVTDPIRQVRFEGKIKLGVLKGEVTGPDGLSQPVGLYNSHLKNFEVADGVCISNVGRMEGYRVEKGVLIENTSSLCVTGETTFGNGTEIEVLNEGGGRKLPIYDRLTAQIAYLMVNYRHDQALIDRLEKLIGNYSAARRSNRGVIGAGAIIRDCVTIRNVNVGPAAQISGATLLAEGTVASTPEAPVIMGHGVTAKQFIIQSGSRVSDGVLLDKCFVGQGVRIGKQFSAEGSVFFANCEAFHGEGVSLFAGPYTVTHHKSSLLIAGQFSFFNAGSGANQSNHMYKLGPLHQGLLERGCKTGSSAYLLWPARVGAFSVVMGKHETHFDSSAFPFSYLTVEDGKTMLTPAMNLFTVGTKRDSAKWPKRDRRQDPDKLDLIRFELLSPYVIQKVIEGRRILQDLYASAPKGQKYVKQNGLTIPRLLLKTCGKYYQLALKKYYGDELLKKLDNRYFHDLAALQNILQPMAPRSGRWIDAAGLLAPEFAVTELVEDLKNGSIAALADLRHRWEDIYDQYEDYAWSWFLDTLQKEEGIQLDQTTEEQLIELIRQWRDSSLKLNNMILKDAEKEFDQNSSTGFGIDGDDITKAADFKAVRGAYEENAFVQGLHAENAAIDRRAKEWIERLEEVFMH